MCGLFKTKGTGGVRYDVRDNDGAGQPLYNYIMLFVLQDVFHAMLNR